MQLNGKQTLTLVLGTGFIGIAGFLIALRVLNFTQLSSVTEKAWRTHAAEIAGNKGDVLEVGTLKNEETLEKRTGYEWWGVYLGTNYSRIRVPVTYRYHIRLSDNWDLSVTGNVCRVKAPLLRPSLPPAIDTAGVEHYSERGWARIDAEDHMEALEKSLTAELSERAGDAAHTGLIRDAARKSIAAFVKTWLLDRGAWKPSSIDAIIVRFADEEMPAQPVEADLLR